MKLIHFPGTDAIEFYDLQEDPLEERNVADDPNYSVAMCTLRIPSASLMSWKTEPSEEAPKLRWETFRPVFPNVLYCMKFATIDWLFYWKFIAKNLNSWAREAPIVLLDNRESYEQEGLQV